MSDSKYQVMSEELYNYQYFFEVACEYTYDIYGDDCLKILYRTFPDFKDAINVKLEHIRKGERIKPKFTEKDAEMEKILS